MQFEATARLIAALKDFKASSDRSAKVLIGLTVVLQLSAQLSAAETQGTANNASSAYVYEARQVIAVRRTEIRIEISPHLYFRSDQSAMRAISRWDLVVPNPAAVVRIRGITP